MTRLCDLGPGQNAENAFFVDFKICLQDRYKLLNTGTPVGLYECWGALARDFVLSASAEMTKALQWIAQQHEPSSRT